MRGALLLLFACHAASALSPDEALARLREIVADQSRRIPNYACVQTLSRESSHIVTSVIPRTADHCAARAQMLKRGGLIVAQINKYRMEVRVGEHSEMYSWVGTNRFTDTNLSEMVGHGPTSTGAIGPVLTTVVEDAPDFKAQASLERSGLYGYTFRVPLERSHFMFDVSEGEAVAAPYSGTIWVDGATGEPRRLEIVVEHPPLEDTCRFNLSLEYAPVRVGSSDFHIPWEALQTFATFTGQVENRVSFSACRQYTAKSTVNFQGKGVPVESAAGSQPPAPLDLPSGTAVVGALAGVIDSDIAAAGDPFSGRLVKPIRSADGRELAPAGAPIRGRITGVERVMAPASVLILLALESVEVDGRQVPVGLSAPRPALPPKPAAQLLKTRGMRIGELPQIRREGFTQILHEGKHLVLSDGYRIEWYSVNHP